MVVEGIGEAMAVSLEVLVDVGEQSNIALADFEKGLASLSDIVEK